MSRDLTLVEFRDFMKDLAAKDKAVKSVHITGASVEECLEQAAIELSTSVTRLEYEIIVKGSKGFLGFDKKNYSLVVYKIDDKKEGSADIEEFGTDDFVDEYKVPDKDGEAIVSFIRGDVFLKITAPSGNGKKVSDNDAFHNLTERNVTDYDKSMILSIVENADNMSVKIASFEYRPSNDSTISYKIEESNMKAYMFLSAPGEGGGDLSKDSILSFLKNNMIVHGVNHEALDYFLDHPVYNSGFIVAEGTLPKNGKDAEIIYNFDVDTTASILKEKNGKVDFKDKNLVQNVVGGQQLAEKIPAEKGVQGRTVIGNILEPRNGIDKELKLGNNTELSKDGLKVIATCNGQVMLVSDKITVEDIYYVDGDVNLITGNIHFLGTVVVKGNVEDSFSVKASGNIEIMGNVGKCTLDALGSIIVHQGINAEENGHIKAGKSIMAKFIQNSHVEAGEIVFVTDGILNSYVDSNGKIICKGKRATIVGGKLRATEEISAKTFGSLSVGSTILEVGFDPKSKERLLTLEKQKDILDKELDDIDRNFVTLGSMKLKMRNHFPPEKQEMLEDMESKIIVLKEELSDIAKENDEIYKHIKEFKSVGKISASASVHQGVKIYIRDAFLDIKNDLKRITFINEDSIIKTIKYEESEDEEIVKED